MKRKILVVLTILFVLISISSSIYLSIKTTDLIEARKAGLVGKAIGYVMLCIDIDLPILDPIGNLTAYVGIPFNFKVNATSPDNATLYYGDNTFIFDIDEPTGWINFTPSLDDEGNHSIKINVSHRICDSEDSEIINFTIEADNPPEWNESKNYSFNLTEDENFYLNISNYVTDPDNDTINFSSNVTGFPSFNLTLDGIINFTPIDADVGFHFFNITASDGVFDVPHIFNFSVNNTNDAPVLDYIPTPQYTCEDDLFYYDVNATDGDLLIPNSSEVLYFYNNPKTLFVINEDTGEIVFIPDYDDAGNNLVNIYVTDEEEFDSQDVTFIVIPVNDAPVLDPIGAKTVRVNQTLYFIATANDEEDGDNSDGNLSFNISFSGNVTLFDINATTGEVNYTPIENETGNYNATICVTDQGISEPENSSLCGNDHFPKTICENFSVAVLEINNPPIIISYYPENNVTLVIDETESIYFNVSAMDPDNTTLTIYWYVNSFLEDSHFGDEDNYTFTTTYGDAGDYIILVVASDGEANDTESWNVTVLPRERPPPGGGGGGREEIICKEMWQCTVWSECQNISEIQSILTRGQYEYWASKCYRLMIVEKVSFWQCGIQTRVCLDFAQCNTFIDQPSGVMACVLVPPPSCFDGIRNCHHGDCEILIDCGGPCEPCPVQIEKPPKYEPKIGPRCGDGICHMSEVFTCFRDCYMFWILWLVAIGLALIIVVKIRQSKKKKKVKKVKEKEKE